MVDTHTTLSVMSRLDKKNWMLLSMIMVEDADTATNAPTLNRAKLAHAYRVKMATLSRHFYTICMHAQV